MAQLNDLIVTGASRLLNGLGILGSTNADSIFPNITDTYALGSSDKRWNSLYAKTSNIDTQTVSILTVSNYATVGANQAATGTGTGALRVNGGLSATQNSWFGKSIIMTPSNGVGIKIGAATITAASTTNGEILLQGGHLRFGGSGWDYNVWAGLKYDSGSKTIYLGLADGTVFTANSAQAGGTLALPGVRYLSINGKEVIDAGDAWLRINQNKTFSSGTYFGQSIVRTDSQFQIGDSGNKFYANSSGNGYFSNTLGVGATNTSYKIYTNGKTKVGDGAASTSTSTGALQVGGGIGVSGNSYFGGSITIANDILPEATNTRVLGSSSKYWKEAYITKMYGSADTVDGFHYGEAPYTHSNSYTQPTASTVWYLKISTAKWNSNSETIYIKAGGDNRNGTIILKTGSRQSRWFGWATNYNGTCVSGVKKIVSESDDIYIRLDSGTTSVTVKTTFSPTITVVTDADGYTDVPSAGGLFGNGIAATTFYGNLSGNVTGNVTGALTGNASTATTLQTARTLTIGNTSRSFNGTANVSWTIAEIGAATASHTHGLLHSNFNKQIDNTTTDSGWSMINSSYNGFMLMSLRTQANAPAWIQNNYAAGVAFGGSDTKGVFSVAYNAPLITIAGGNGTKPVWYIKLAGMSGTTYDLANFGATYLKDKTNGTASYLNYGSSGMTSASWYGAWDGYTLRAISPANLATHLATTSLDDRYVKKSGDFMSGPLRIDTSLQDHSSPTAHCLVINSSTGTPTLKNSPGIGFHIANVSWASLIFDTSGFRFLNSSFDGYVPVFCSTLYGTSKDTANASYRTTDGGANYILVKINNDTHYMTAFTVRVYQGYNAYDVTFSGYQYGTNYWYSPQATLTNSTVASLTVYFGYNSYNEMWVALPGSSYTGAKVINVINGYQPLDMVNAFSITRVSSLPGTIQSTQTIYRSWRRGEAVTGAVWNDYAECRQSEDKEPGYVMIENGDDTLSKSTDRLQHFAGIVSDTWGFSQGETEKAKTHIAVAGRVLAYTYRPREEYKPGDCVCTAPGGTIDIMTREEVILWPDRVVGTVSIVPNYEEWGGGEMADRDPVKVNNRIWIKVR